MLSKQRLVGMTNILGLDFLPLRWYKCRMIHGMEKPLTLSLTIPANHPWGMVENLPSSLFLTSKTLDL